MLLCIDTALAGLSVALCDGERLVAEHHAVLGRGHAEAVVPAVAALLDSAGVVAPTTILVDVGPGSFTGLRIGIAAARALGLAWGVPVHGVTALSLVAARAFVDAPKLREIVVILDAGRGQVFMQSIDRASFTGTDPLQACAPDVAARLTQGKAVAGPGASLLAGACIVCDEWPHAGDAVLLPMAARQLAPEPIYVRAPDTKSLATRG